MINKAKNTSLFCSIKDYKNKINSIKEETDNFIINSNNTTCIIGVKLDEKVLEQNGAHFNEFTENVEI